MSERREGIVMIDGAVVAPEDAKVSVYDRGFLYGDSVFEVLRTYAGAPFALDEHVARLARSAERVAIRMPLDEDSMQMEVKRAIRAAASGAPADAEWYARVILTRGAGPPGLDADLATAPLRVILVEPVSPPPREHYTNGIALATVATRRTVDETSAAGAKVSNYLANLLALREAKARGAQEALIVDGHGLVVEGASSNVFVVRAGKVRTPPESAGILPGITRSHILAVAAQRGIAVELSALAPADLYAADEVFVTSSIRELLSAVSVDGRAIGTGKPGPVARALHRAFRERVGMGARPMPYD
jgi:branched-chain amino acid aminotransferase